MHRRKLISSIVLAVLTAVSFTSCKKGLIPEEVSGLGDVLKGATESLQGITGVDAGEAVAKAKEALPSLEGAGTQLGAVQGLMEKLPAPAKAIVTKALESFGPTLTDLIGKVSGIPGVSGVVQPALDKITAGLAALQG